MRIKTGIQLESTVLTQYSLITNKPLVAEKRMSLYLIKYKHHLFFG